ncbi:hypothetical protein GQ457_12G013450 [Hibiscus cannabinus]
MAPGAEGKQWAGGRPPRVLLPHTLLRTQAPRCWRQAHHRREEGPLGCYSRTPCADSMPLGAGGKNTIGGRKAPIGCHSRTPCANSWPLGAGGKQTKGRRKGPSGATPAHLVPTQGPRHINVYWDLRSVLLRMGFHSDWVTLIMDCVSTVTFRVRINGRLSPVIIPQRGLRQGDPLSPFLFVICMQGLSATLLAEQEAGRIMGVRASQKGPRVNHLLYADDSIVFIRNSKREAFRLKEVLRIFADSSGQCINFGKSTVFYSPSTPSADRHRLSAILGITEVFDPGIYLGVALRVGKNKTNIFGFLNEKVDDRVSGWTKRLLSFGGREIFLKSVAQALPVYIMSCYLLPRSITDRITSSMRRPSPLWKALKTLPTLPKVRIFAWRLAHDCLPTGGRVAAAGLGPGLCPFCSDTIETSLHAFRDCPLTAEALHLGGFSSLVTDSRADTILDWLLAVARTISREDFAKLILILWNLWNRRNLWVHDSRLQPVWATVTAASLLHSDFRMANDNGKHPRARPLLSTPIWSPPTPGIIAISVDGAFIQFKGAGIGVVARDSAGTVCWIFREGVSELCSRDYSGGLSRDLSVISRWDSRSNLDVSRRNQVVILLRELCVLRYLRDPGNEGVRFLRSTIRSRRLGDQIVREFVSS